MKLLSITIKNVGLIEDSTIKLNKPLSLFYGEIRQGKTTILNSVKWCFGGAFPQDIIRHGEREASIELTFEGGSIRREFYIAKDQTTKAREIAFVRDGKTVKRPVDEIKKFLNPFLLDQDYLRNMGEAERKQYFTELFNVKTDDLDTQVIDCETEARDLRAKIKGYGDIDLTPVESVDVAALRDELIAVKAAHSEKVEGWNAEIAEQDAAYQSFMDEIVKQNQAAEKHNSTIDRGKTRLSEIDVSVADHETQIAKLKTERAKVDGWLTANPVRPPSPLPKAPDVTAICQKINAAPDTSELDAQISAAAANEVRVEQHKKNVGRAKERREDELSLSGFEKRLRELKAEKIARLQGISESSGIKGLSFDEAGNFSYHGTQAGMLSTSQIMQLSSELSGLYPPGFGLDLIDRGESLGKSIFDFIGRAEREEKTILATIVGEQPADVPENVGVFIVQNGKVKPSPRKTLAPV